MEGRWSPKTPILFAGASGHSIKSLDAACILEKKGKEKHAYFHKSWGIKGENIKLLKHVFALYSFPIIFSKTFYSLATLAWLRFILHLEMQTCNVLYQLHLNCLFFGAIISDCQLPKFTCMKLHKIAYCIKCPKSVCRGGGGEKGGCENGRDVVLGTRTRVQLEYKFEVLVLVLVPRVLVLVASVLVLVLVLVVEVLVYYAISEKDT